MQKRIRQFGLKAVSAVAVVAFLTFFISPMSNFTGLVICIGSLLIALILAAVSGYYSDDA